MDAKDSAKVVMSKKNFVPFDCNSAGIIFMTALLHCLRVGRRVNSKTTKRLKSLCIFLITSRSLRFTFFLENSLLRKKILYWQPRFGRKVKDVLK